MSHAVAVETDTASRIWGRLAAVTIVVLAHAGTPEAQPPQTAPRTWAVKFVCGQRAQPAERRDWNAVAPGFYYTAINILNSSGERVKVITQIATTNPTPTGGTTRPGPDLELRPLQAAEVDCEDILRMTPRTQFLKGFVTIESTVHLAITAVYTAANAAGVSSIDVEKVSSASPQCPDLVIAPAGRPSPNTPAGRTTVPAVVRNIGSARAPDTRARVDDPNRTDALRAAEADVPALDPGAAATVDLVLNYVLTGSTNLAVLLLTVDPKNLISECREDNNSRPVGAP